ncbi:unnamed protein product, partial [Brenthis ino]
MVALYFVLFSLVSSLNSGFAYIIGEKKTLDLPIEYHVRGETTDLVTGILTPFEAWYSEENKKSRNDVYHGLVKTYYIGEDEDLTTVYKIHPITTEMVTNEIQCEKDYSADDTPKIFPAGDNFTYSGDVIYYNKAVQVWKLLEIDEKRKEDTMYVYTNEDGEDIPVWRELKVYTEWSGAISDHVIVHYFDFKKPNYEDLNVTLVTECEDVLIVSGRHEHSSSQVDETFHGYKMQHNRNYKGEEHRMRKSIFEENLRRVIEHNKKNLPYKLTINKFSDRTAAELAYLSATRPSDPLAFGSEPFPYSEEEVNQMVQDLPENYDMRIDGVISVVKNQASCGSCWSFATVAAIEGAYARRYGDRLLNLSEQSLVDCAWGFTNMGCNGGFIESTYKYVIKHGIPAENEYGTYLAEDGMCRLENMTDVYRIKGFGRVPPQSINAMKVALYKYGPVTVTINADPIFDYGNGIFYNVKCNDRPLNHAVTIVGYGVRDGATYWIVKNSWGEDWGQDGYILFSTLNNNCHILDQAYYPIV